MATEGVNINDYKYCDQMTNFDCNKIYATLPDVLSR